MLIVICIFVTITTEIWAVIYVLKGGKYYYIVSCCSFFICLFRHFVNDNSFKLVDLYLIYSGYKISRIYIQLQILIQRFTLPKYNDNVGGYIQYVHTNSICIGPLVLSTFFSQKTQFFLFEWTKMPVTIFHS